MGRRLWIVAAGTARARSESDAGLPAPNPAGPHPVDAGPGEAHVEPRPVWALRAQSAGRGLTGRRSGVTGRWEHVP